MRIDLRPAIETVEELLAELRQMDGVEPDDTPTRAGRRQRVELSRTFLYLGHLADRARVQVMDEYYAYKDRADPVEGGEQGER